MYVHENVECLMESSSGRKLLVHTGAVTTKTTKNTQGLVVMTQLKGQKLVKVSLYDGVELDDPDWYRTDKLPSSGKRPSQKKSESFDVPKIEQLNFF